MCKSRMQVDDILDMISSINRKQARMQGNLRLEALLKNTYNLLYKELEVKQQNRKRKWIDMISDAKKPKCEDEVVPMIMQPEDDILGLDDFFTSLNNRDDDIICSVPLKEQ